MPDQFADLRHELAVANRILANEGIIDAFGHISTRHPKDPNRYFISRHRGQPEFEAECILFQPIVDGAGVLYVVDGSEPLLEIHAAEITFDR